MLNLKLGQKVARLAQLVDAKRLKKKHLPDFKSKKEQTIPVFWKMRCQGCLHYRESSELPKVQLCNYLYPVFQRNMFKIVIDLKRAGFSPKQKITWLYITKPLPGPKNNKPFASTKLTSWSEIRELFGLLAYGRIMINTSQHVFVRGYRNSTGNFDFPAPNKCAPPFFLTA